MTISWGMAPVLTDGDVKGLVRDFAVWLRVAAHGHVRNLKNNPDGCVDRTETDSQI